MKMSFVDMQLTDNKSLYKSICMSIKKALFHRILELLIENYLLLLMKI